MISPKKSSVLLLALCLSGPVTTVIPKDEVSTQVSSSTISWIAQHAPGYGWQLTVSGPNDWYFRRTFSAGESASFTPSDNLDGSAPDGQYNYELVSILVDGQTTARTDEAAITDTFPLTATGAFLIDGGTIIGDDGTSEEVITKTAVLTGDYSIDGSLCVGINCTSSEAFGFDTIRLKEDNLRIKFEDTSISTGFPTNDWQITANDSSNGGANKLSIDDITGGRTLFTITAGAPSNSLFVDAQGDVGFGTSTPAVNLHAVDGNTPTLRLEQNGSAGFTPQIWDVAGNEAGFFIRDATNGSTLPFRILPGAPSQSLVIDGDGEVGIGAGTSPDAKLHIVSSASDTNPALLIEKQGVETEATLFTVKDSGNATLLQVLSQGSDRNIKKNIEPVDTSQILKRISELPIAEWSYKTDSDSIRHLGPMSQDFYSQFNLGVDDKHIAPLDGVGLSLAAIQELHKQLEEQKQLINQLQSK
jgi:hypothetical protein